ncbi:MAG TPA: tRNA uridine-5-carboxymethylaminomethyl(34) synthesis GTPase MnmE [Pseudomonadota bacterium]|nr:tRNA uridine-5-carboxymethylaminomethyl(34) synthesis GTPase MnmE [Pseudomonadota bacterium]
MPADRDTIAAIASAAGSGGIGVVRVSGPRAAAIARGLLGRKPRPRHAVFAALRDRAGVAIDRGLVLYFRAPASYTGEDVLELHGHGSPVVLAALLERCIELGARHARAGEFTERAFLNGKLDLAQAEAVADLIASGSIAQARAALRSMEGVFSARVVALDEAITRVRIWVEAAIDFPEEEIDFLADARLREELDGVRAALDALLHEARQGQRLRDGLHVVILGAPNAGKSSLLNVLAGSDRAIVTAIPGTTRDVLRETVRVAGVELTLADTAGLRDTGDAIEAEGMRRARAEVARADLALLVIDASLAPDRQARDRAALASECPPALPRVWIETKCDLAPVRSAAPRTPPVGAASAATAASPVAAEAAPTAQDIGTATSLQVSALTGAGLDALRHELARRAGAGTEGTFSARARQVAALERAAAHLALGAEALDAQRAGELLAEELRLAHQALGEITGQTTADDLLGRIFGEFCIGK